MLKGVITAIVTPFTNDYLVDFDAFDRLIELQIAGGVAGIVIIGSTGEASTLDNKEKISVIKHAINTINRRVKIIVGVGFACTSTASKFIDLANNISGIDYIMALTPSYVKPTQEGLYQHFATLARLSKAPIILYNVPSRTGCNLEDTTTLRLARDFTNIVGLKDATGDIARCCYLVKHRLPGFILLSGDDATAMAFMLCGGNGVISVVSNLVPKLFSKLCNFALEGKISDAIQVNGQILELHSLMFIESNPIPVKWALFNQAIINTPVLRLPLTPLTKQSQDIIGPAITLIMSDENNVD
jgi:4-hydroxy-tetrahydrodipicolinate synthase